MPTTIHQRRWRVNFSQEALAKMFTDSRGLSSDGEAYLVLRDNQTWRDVYRLDPAVAHSIGRDETNEFVLNDHRCSRRHCSIQRVDGEWTIQDLDSRNGTAVNGIKIPAQQYLGDGDIIRVGRTQFLFTCDLTQRFADDYGGDDSGEEEETSHDSDSEDASSSDSSVADDPQIVEVQGNSGLFSEGLVNSDDEGLRRAFSNLYKLIARLVSAPTVPALCEVVLDEVCAALDVEMGAVLLFPPGHDDPTDVDELRILAYHAPQGAPYQKVSTRLSRAALKQRQGVLAMDVGRHTEFQTLHDLKAQSVVCAPIQTDDYLFGLLHLYSLRAEQPLDTESLAFAVAVTEQTAASLVRLNQR
ncbi:MAG: FHA domain-containing protein, partial [Pirellulaceae bacterium]|nr:FHA domain-containing protein [Pirellulaceae bacterium]